MKTQVKTNSAPQPAGPYSQGIVAGNTVYVSGQRPADPETGIIPETIEEQTAQVIRNVEQVLQAAGSGLDKLVRTTVYLADIKDFDRMNSVYREMIPAPYPARSTFSPGLRGILIEIDAVAIL